MFRKHPLRDFLLFLLIGITVTFAFNLQASSAGGHHQLTKTAK